MSGIRSGLDSVKQRMEESDWFDADFAQDHAETLLGLAFVATQAYVLGACVDYNKAREHRGLRPMRYHECHALDTVSVAGGVTRVQLIVATANYFKHQDEWLRKKWPRKEHGVHTVEALARVGITETTDYPCGQAAYLLCGKEWKLDSLCKAVRSWRDSLFRDLSKETRGKPGK